MYNEWYVPPCTSSVRIAEIRNPHISGVFVMFLCEERGEESLARVDGWMHVYSVTQGLESIIVMVNTGAIKSYFASVEGGCVFSHIVKVYIIIL